MSSQSERDMILRLLEDEDFRRLGAERYYHTYVPPTPVEQFEHHLDAVQRAYGMVRAGENRHRVGDLLEGAIHGFRMALRDLEKQKAKEKQEATCACPDNIGPDPDPDAPNYCETCHQKIRHASV